MCEQKPTAQNTCRGYLLIPLIVALALLLASQPLSAQSPASGQKWVASWAASVHGPYPSGNATAQPELKYAFPSPETGAIDQTFRLMVRPDLWSNRVRLRLSNAFGTQSVVFDDVYVGMQASGGNLVAGTNKAVTFGGKGTVTVAPGESRFSDAVELKFVKDPASPDLAGRKLAVSFHVVGSSGLMTWHAKALTTSYLSEPESGSHSKNETDEAFRFTTTSWYFLDAIDVMADADTVVIAAFGDSITDGTASTLNGDDRWPDVLSRRLHAAYGTHVSVVNEGIGGNRILGPSDYSAIVPDSGGPSALDRLERDVFGLSGLSAVIWLEGINDLGRADASAEAVIEGMREGAKRMRQHGGIKVIGGTITSSLKSTNGTYGSATVNERRKAVNQFIRTTDIFDGVADFDAATLDKSSGTLQRDFQPNSTIGGPGDLLHPNRAGYQAMGNAVDIKLFAPSGVPKQNTSK